MRVKLGENMSEREQITQEKIEMALKIVEETLKYRLDEKGYGTFCSSHEVLGVLTEEFYELVEAVKSNDIMKVEKELIDVAVGALFGIACILQNSVD